MCALTPGVGADSAVLASSLTMVGASPPDRGNPDPRSRERIGGGHGESRRVALRAVGAAVWVALTASCVVSGLSGALIPLALKRFGFDPATASSIFLTTMTDICSMGVFLGLATLFL